MQMSLHPQTLRQWRRFKSIRRGYLSAVILLFLIIASLFAELWVNNRALMVRFGDEWHFPTYSAFKPGTTFGLEYEWETNYRQLQGQFAADDRDDTWVLMPLVPFSPYEDDFIEGSYPPYAPSEQHWIGTDTTGRDILARLLYGFRIAILFAFVLLVANYLTGLTLGCAMGYFGGAFDLVVQRLIEIWSTVPFLYVVMIVASIIAPNFWTLAAVMIAFGWMTMTWFMRTATYKETARDYVMAARALGASPMRVIFRHVMPNTVSVIITFVPFSIAGSITALTALDYLGFGLPPPTPSWGELIGQGLANLQKPWIIASVVTVLSLVLVMVTFVGEAIREALDPKQLSHYE